MSITKKNPRENTCPIGSHVFYYFNHIERIKVCEGRCSRDTSSTVDSIVSFILGALFTMRNVSHVAHVPPPSFHHLFSTPTRAEFLISQQAQNADGIIRQYEFRVRVELEKNNTVKISIFSAHGQQLCPPFTVNSSLDPPYVELADSLYTICKCFVEQTRYAERFAQTQERLLPPSSTPSRRR